jgi:hypothetical protein
VAWIGLGGPAFGSVPLPDPVLQAPPPAVPLVPEPSGWQEVHWMLTGAGIVALIVAVVAVGVVLVSQRRVQRRRSRLCRRFTLG